MSDEETASEDSGPVTWTDLEVLDPDHPILERFQQNLQHLLTQESEQLTLKIRQLEVEEKDGRKTREKLGSVLYDLQRSVESSGNLVTNSKKQLASAVEKRQAKLVCLQEQAAKLDKIHSLLNEALHKEKESQKEVDMSSLRVVQLQNKLNETKSQLTRTKGLLDHGHRERDSRHANKILKDFEIAQLMAEIEIVELAISREEEATLLDEEVVSSMRDTIRGAHLEMSVLNAESMRVHQAWQKSVQLLQKRNQQVDETLQLVRDEERQLEIATKAVESAVGDLVQLEERQTFLQLHSGRVERRTQHWTNKMKTTATKKVSLQQRMAGTQEAVKANEDSLRTLGKELDAAQREQATHLQKYERIRLANRLLEDSILHAARNNVVKDQQVTAICQKLHQLDISLQNLELDAAQLENTISRTFLEKGKLWVALETRREVAANQEKLVTLWRQKLDKKEAQLNDQRKTLSAKENQLIRVNVKLTELQILVQNRLCETEEQRVIMSLEDQLKQAKCHTSKLQRDWTASQELLLSVASARDQIAAEQQRYLQESEVWANKKLRLEQQLLQLEQNEKRVRRSVHALHQTLHQLDGQLAVTKNCKENGQRLAKLWQTEWKQIIEEPERKLVQLENELDVVREQKAQQELNLCNYAKMLAMWQAKFQEIRDTRHYVLAETSDAGAAAASRAEIHRLEVEQLQLRREQEQLNQQLEKCVLGRSLLTAKADIQETVQRKKSGGKSRDSKTAPWHKLLSREIADLAKELRCIADYERNLRAHYANLEAQKQELESFLRKTRENNEQLKNELDIMERSKFQAIGTLVQLQECLKFLEKAKTGKYRPRYNDRETMLEAQGKFQQKLEKVAAVIDSVENSYPQLALETKCLREKML